MQPASRSLRRTIELAAASCATALAVPIAVAFQKFEPLNDPIGIVGVPAMTGYSERSEFAGMAFLVGLAAGLAFWLAGWIAKRLPPRPSPWAGECVEWLAAIFVHGIVASGAWARGGFGVVAASALGLAGCWIARTRWIRQRIKEPQSRIRSLTAVAFACIAFPELTVSMVDNLPNFIALALLVTAGAAGYRLHPARTINAATIIVGVVGVLSILAGSPDRILQAGAAAAAVLVCCLSNRGSTSAMLNGVGIRAASLMLVALALGVAAYANGDWRSNDWLIPVRHAAGGVAIGFGWALLLCNATTPDLVSTCRWLRDPRLPATAMLALWCVLVVRRPVGGLSFGIAAACCGLFGKRRIVAASLAGLATVLTFMPTYLGRVIDSFHDGQILSAVWEAQSGRPIYSEVFPLRSFEFFTTWLVANLVSLTPAGYFAIEPTLGMLAPLSFCLSVFAWTQRPFWGLLAAAATALLPTIDGRLALPFLCAFFSLLAWNRLHCRSSFKQPSRGRAELMGVCGFQMAAGLLAGLGGFDCYLPVMIANGFAAIFSATGRRLAAFGSFACVLGAWPSTILLWQGLDSTVAFVRLGFDYARHYGAFFGLPMPWSTRELAPMLLIPIGINVAWWTLGAAGMRHISCRRRPAWAFVALFALLLLNRGFGRSDVIHLRSFWYPTLFIALLLAFEYLREVDPCLLRRRLGWTETVVAAAGIYGILHSSHGTISPINTWGSFAAMAERQHEWPAPLESITNLVAPHKHLWEMEGAMLAFQCRRHNPTRHALAYCIGVPNEQIAAAKAIEEKCPAAIVWQFDSGSDGIANPLRFFQIMPVIYRDYRPTNGGNLLIPRGSVLDAPDHLGDAFVRPMDMAKLPLAWGRRVSMGIDKSRWRTVDLIRRASRPGGDLVANKAPWTTSPWDILVIDAELEVDAEVADDAASRESEKIRIGFGRDVIDARGPVMFDCGQANARLRYVVPIGCHPNWAWQPRLDSVHFQSPQRRRFRSIDVSVAGHDIFSAK